MDGARMTASGMPSHDFSLEGSRAARSGRGAKRQCACVGCDDAATHRAPCSRDPNAGEYWFCLRHVKEYNANWNYFEGRSHPGFRVDLSAATKSRDPHARTSRQRWPRPVHLLGDTARRALTILGLGSFATDADIRRRFREQVKRLHPDLNGGHQVDTKRLRSVIWAWNKLRSLRRH